MKCPLHRSVEMVAQKERVPFSRIDYNADQEEKAVQKYRIGLHCPIPGCIQVGVLPIEYLPKKATVPAVHAHR